MKKLRIIYLLLFFVTITTIVKAQKDITPDVIRLLKSGNSAELSGYFIPNIDLTVLENDDIYSKEQASQILKKFFEAHKPKNFVIEHEGKSKLDDSYRIGKLTTEKGDYRVTFFLKKIGDKILIKQIRIELNSGNF
jgi:Domain of unknown function (DUF4783)